MDIEKTLEERGSRYGQFVSHAQIAQSLKNIMQSTGNWCILADDQKECLEMIAHKIGRILNGDPNYPDNFIDIAGYSKLVADRLEKMTITETFAPLEMVLTDEEKNELGFIPPDAKVARVNFGPVVEELTEAEVAAKNFRREVDTRTNGGW